MILLQVKDWGSGRQEDLGELQVEAHREFSEGHTKPFYEQLARRLELLQVSRCVQGISSAGVPAVLAVRSWSWQGCGCCRPEARLLWFALPVQPCFSGLRCRHVEC